MHFSLDFFLNFDVPIILFNDMYFHYVFFVLKEYFVPFVGKMEGKTGD